MNFNTLRYVVTVAKESSFTKAAQKLFISQPTLSYSIQALENDLGTPLFDRKTIPVALTYAGKLYVEWAEDILLSESQLNRRISAISRKEYSKLYVGMSPHRSPYMLPPVLKRLSEEFPQCSINICEGTGEELYRRMERRELDVMIHNSPADKVNYASTVVNTERIVLAVPSSYKLKEIIHHKSDYYPSVRLYSLKDKPFIVLSAQYYMGHSVRALCELEDFTPIHGIDCERVELAHKLVAAGLGVTLLPEYFVRLGMPLPNVDYFYIEGSAPKRDICIVNRKNTMLTEPALRFIEIFKEEFSPDGIKEKFI